MRYTKWALLLFGAGLAFGLAVVSVPLPNWSRVASAAMAAGIVLLPVAAVLDWRRRGTAKPKRRQRKPRPRRQSARKTSSARKARNKPQRS